MPKRTFVVSFRRRLVERHEPEEMRVHVETETIGDTIVPHPPEDRSIVLAAGVGFTNSFHVLFPKGTYERFDAEENMICLDDRWSLEVSEEIVSFYRGPRRDMKTSVFMLGAREVRAIRIEYKEGV